MSNRIFLNPTRIRLYIHNHDTHMTSYYVIQSILRGKWKETNFKYLLRNKSYSNPTGTPGSGAGRGGGAGGSVRESGGGLGQYGAAQEEQFFFNKQREQLEKLKKKLKEGKGELSQKEEK